MGKTWSWPAPAWLLLLAGSWTTTEVLAGLSEARSLDLCPWHPFQLPTCGVIHVHPGIEQNDYHEGTVTGNASSAGTRKEFDYWSANNLEVKESPGKGLGVFATKLIRGGSRVMVEPPLFAVDPPRFIPGKGYELKEMIPDIDAALSNLSEEEREEFWGCHEYRLPQEADSSNKNLFIFRSNAYTLGSGQIAMFPKIARINHSCKPNAGGIWSEASDQRIIVAARDIYPGEEVTVTYIPLLRLHDERQQRLAQYGFRCSCETCINHEHTDMRRAEMAGLMELLQNELRQPMSRDSSTVQNLLPGVLSLVSMLEEEHLLEYLGTAYHLAAELHLRAHDASAAREWAVKELKVHRNADPKSLAAQQAREFMWSIHD
ncbi:hypothetical protein BX600DRAFT_69010 [Xylariales sp. PMI_506]|nr:hypothetical protein BX600DRAFT_69010 [Xylariales sp. PMI_506]